MSTIRVYNPATKQTMWLTEFEFESRLQAGETLERENPEYPPKDVRPSAEIERQQAIAEANMLRSTEAEVLPGMMIWARRFLNEFGNERPTNSIMRGLRITPQVKAQLMGLAIALLTGQMKGAEAIAQALESLAAQIRNS